MKTYTLFLIVFLFYSAAYSQTGGGGGRGEGGGGGGRGSSKERNSGRASNEPWENRGSGWLKGWEQKRMCDDALHSVQIDNDSAVS